MKVHNAHAVVAINEEDGHTGIYILTQHVTEAVSAAHPPKGVKIGVFHPENGSFIPREDFGPRHRQKVQGIIPIDGKSDHRGCIILQEPDLETYVPPQTTAPEEARTADRTPANAPRAAPARENTDGNLLWHPKLGHTAIAHVRALQRAYLAYPNNPTKNG